MRVELSPQARRDLLTLTDYGTSQFGLAQFERYAAGLREVLDLLAGTPMMGMAVRTNRLRRIVYRKHYAYYRIEPSRVLITTIRSTRMRPL